MTYFVKPSFDFFGWSFKKRVLLCVFISEKYMLIFNQNERRYKDERKQENENQRAFKAIFAILQKVQMDNDSGSVLRIAHHYMRAGASAYSQRDNERGVR